MFIYVGLPDGNVLFYQNIESIGDENSPIVAGNPYDLVILADGGFSVLRKCVTTQQPEYGGYFLWRGLLALKEFP